VPDERRPLELPLRDRCRVHVANAEVRIEHKHRQRARLEQRHLRRFERPERFHRWRRSRLGAGIAHSRGSWRVSVARQIHCWACAGVGITTTHE
jgi:hypothetical protein